MLTSSRSPQSGAADNAGEEIGFRKRALGKQHIGRGVFEKHAAAERVLDFGDMIGDAGERGGGIGQGQKVVEINFAVARPGEMLRKAFGPVAIAQPAQALQMRAVERSVDADRQADAMQRQREALVQMRELRMRAAAFAHVILGMNLDEADRARVGDQALEMIRLESDAGAGRQRGLDHGGAP